MNSANLLSQQPRVQILVQGCGANQGEASQMEASLLQSGVQIDSKQSQAFLIHACTVKGDQDPLNEISKQLIAKPEQTIVVSGCVTPELGIKLQKLSPLIHIVPSWQKSIELTQNLLGIKALQDQEGQTIAHGRVGTVTISQGCLDRCAFCSTVRVKGKLHSLSAPQILQQVQSLIAQGAVEIRLAGQDTACYGFDIGSNLPALVRQIVALPGDFRLRLGMGNPRHLLGFTEEMAELLNHPKVFRFLHLPIQSGSDQVLRIMRRRHRVEDFVQLVQSLEQMIPEITFSTDIIVGHPGEQDRDFQETLDLVRKFKPHYCNITRFVPREKTLSARLAAPISEIAKQRSRELTEVYRQIAWERHKENLNCIQDVVPIEYNPREGHWIGRTANYLKIACSGSMPTSKLVQLKVMDAMTFGLKGITLPH